MEKCIKRRDNIPHKEVEGKVLLLNLKDGDYYGLNQIGFSIWKMLDGTKTRCDIIKTLKKRLDIREDVIRKDVSDFLRQLNKHKLIEFI